MSVHSDLSLAVSGLRSSADRAACTAVARGIGSRVNQVMQTGAAYNSSWHVAGCVDSNLNAHCCEGCSSPADRRFWRTPHPEPHQC
eukprot:7391998-Prymnesium_polylepis.2